MKNLRNGHTLKRYILRAVKDIQKHQWDISLGHLNLALLSKIAVLITCPQAFYFEASAKSLISFHTPLTT